MRRSGGPAGIGRRPAIGGAAASGVPEAPRRLAPGACGFREFRRFQRPEPACGSRKGMAGPGPGDPDEHYDFLFKLVLVGDASVGKTCVVQRFKTGAFSERQSSTIGVDFTMKTLEIQGKRVKVGGPAWGPRARVACSLWTLRSPSSDVH